MQKNRILSPLSFLLLFAITFLTNSVLPHAEPLHDDGQDIPILSTPVDIRKEEPENDIAQLLRYSDYVLSVEGDAGVYYHDNIYRTRNGKTSDTLTQIAPRIRGKSLWERHELNFDLKGELGIYASESENNYSDVDARISGRYDFLNNMSADLWGRYRYDHSSVGEDPDQPDTTLKEPPTYDYFEMGGALRGLFVPLYHWELSLTSMFYDYDNSLRRDGVLSIYDDKDRNEHSALATLSYDIAPQSQIFVRGGANIIRYDERVDSSLLYDHDAEGYLALTGFSKDTDNMFWSIAGGYQHQDYKAPELEDVSMLAFQAEAEFLLGPATELSFDLIRSIRESSSTGVSAYIQSRGNIALEHRFNSNWSASAGARYTINDFQANTAISGIDRKDKVFEPALATHYDINDHAQLSLEYKYAERSSNDGAVEYDANVIGLRLRLRP